ncbi:hypothetical protein M413DRAFT_25980 [Hebeloma cylindrosporum]|uniref:Uncharacterized protein n=1 Tax=Hebeloma cylindrosporum TaxID=76867 RepID=A0A0C3CIY9_HEBCY|nr:hypothetical protein M413DRAFT_25980 [Hebeloma cylindrosporum h7]
MPRTSTEYDAVLIYPPEPDVTFQPVQSETATPIAPADFPYYILLKGADRLENMFSHVRTHAHNFDILQLSHKLSIAAKIDAVFQWNPDLHRGHIHPNLIMNHISQSQMITCSHSKSMLGHEPFQQIPDSDAVEQI